MARSSDAAFPMSLVRDKTFQSRQIRRVMWLTLFFIVQSTLVLGLFYYFLLGDIVAGTAPILFASEDMARLNEQIPSVGTVMLRWLLVMLGLNALVTAVICIYIMRRLGSPILAIDRALNDIGDGNLNVRLRETDSGEFNELCVSLNRATAKIQSRIEAVREEVRVLESLDTQPAPSPEDVHNAVQNCRNVLSFFRADSKSGENAANGDS